MSSINEILSSIIPSLDSAQESAAKLIEQEADTEYPELISKLLADEKNKLEDVSLLNLKSDALLSYINNLILVILSQVQRIKSDTESIRDQAIESTITQRTTLERGIKPLEKKLNYQLEKMIRTYNKMLSDFERNEKDEENDKGSDNDSNEDNDSSEEESEDELAYRPDASSLMKKPSKKTSDTSTSAQGVYKPPKISAMAPPTAKESSRDKPSKKLQSMEEYLRESSDLPMEEKSIGVNIVNHGRGGIKTDNERKKEHEIQAYEEENFIRLPTTVSKKDKTQKRKDLANTFGGEDWSIFNNSRDMNESTSRKRKNKSVWDKVKRKK